MKKNFMLMFIPLIISIVLDLILVFPKNGMIILWAILYIIFTFIFKDKETKIVKKINYVRNIIITSTISIFAFIILLLLKNNIIYMKQGIFLMIVQVILALICSTGILIVINLCIIKIQNKKV